jgi:GNAT superfamily N-acetyltransferase
MDVTLRLAGLNDVPALENLIHESVSVLSERFYTPAQISSALTNVFGVDTRLISDGTYYIAELDGQLAGSGGWSKRLTLFGGDRTKSAEPDRLLDPRTEAARIRAFYVHPQAARRGIATAILQACESAARDAGFRKIELVATLPGEPLYLARGYVKVEPMQLPIPDGEPLPALRMAKIL